MDHINLVAAYRIESRINSSLVDFEPMETVSE